MYVVESRLYADNRYAWHGGRKTPNGVCVHHSILIRGHKGKTPMHSTVSAEDHDWLKDDPVFQQHVANGSFIIHPAVPVGVGAQPADKTEGQHDEGAESAGEDLASMEEMGEKSAAKQASKEPTKAGSGKKAK